MVLGKKQLRYSQDIYSTFSNALDCIHCCCPCGCSEVLTITTALLLCLFMGSMVLSNHYLAFWFFLVLQVLFNSISLTSGYFELGLLQ